jgi:hypothetical protein
VKFLNAGAKPVAPPRLLLLLPLQSLPKQYDPILPCPLCNNNIIYITLYAIDVQMGSACWAGINTAHLNTACERHGPACPVLEPGTARTPCPCWFGIPARQHDTGTTRSNGRHDPRHDIHWIPGTAPCDCWIPASPHFLYNGQRRPSVVPPTLTLVHLHAPSSLSSLAAAALSTLFSLPHPPLPAPPWIGILNHSFSHLAGDVASSSPRFPHPPRLHLIDVLPSCVKW